MDLIAILKIAVRRWYVFLGVLLITGAVGLVAQQNVPSTYTVNFSVQITAPYFDSLDLQGQFNQNPYSDLNISGYVANAIATSDQAKEDIVQAGGTDQYVSSYDTGSVIPLTITGTSAQRTLHTYELLLQVVRAGMAQKQDQLGVPEALRVRVDEVVPPVGATEIRGDATKVLVAVVGIGVVAAFGAAALVDAFFGAGRRGGSPARVPRTPLGRLSAGAREAPAATTANTAAAAVAANRTNGSAPAAPEPVPASGPSDAAASGESGGSPHPRWPSDEWPEVEPPAEPGTAKQSRKAKKAKANGKPSTTPAVDHEEAPAGGKRRRPDLIKRATAGGRFSERSAPSGAEAELPPELSPRGRGAGSRRQGRNNGPDPAYPSGPDTRFEGRPGPGTAPMPHRAPPAGVPPLGTAPHGRPGGPPSGAPITPPPLGRPLPSSPPIRPMPSAGPAVPATTFTDARAVSGTGDGPGERPPGWIASIPMDEPDYPSDAPTPSIRPNRPAKADRHGKSGSDRTDPASSARTNGNGTDPGTNGTGRPAAGRDDGPATW